MAGQKKTTTAYISMHACFCDGKVQNLDSGLWTLDWVGPWTGPDHGLDYGLDYGLRFGIIILDLRAESTN